MINDKCDKTINDTSGLLEALAFGVRGYSSDRNLMQTETLCRPEESISEIP